MKNLADYAATSVHHIREIFPGQPDWLFVMGVAAEAGEMVSAYLRYTGKVRRLGTREDIAGELADTVLTSYRAADVLEIDLDKAIAANIDKEQHRGWIEERH